MKPQLNTPINNPNKSEVEVVDPTHPLFGRKFQILSANKHERAGSHVLVSFCDGITLKIPIASTDLVEYQQVQCSILTLSSVNELISIINECEELCHVIQKKSGKTFPHNLKKRSIKKSQTSSRR